MMCDRITAAPMHSLVSWVDFLLLHKKYVLYYISELIVYLQWTTFLDSEGRVMDSKALRKRVFYGGVEHNLRAEVWVFEDDFLFWKHAITLFHSVMFFMSRVCYESHHYDLQVWTFLMGYHEYGSTYAEREYLMSIRKSEYETIKRQWQVSYWFCICLKYRCICFENYFKSHYC